MQSASRIVPLVLLLGCTPAGVPSRGASSAATFEVGAGAVSYGTRPTAGAVRGGADAEGVERALLEVARARGMVLAGDGRLAELGAFIAGTLEPTGTPPTSSTVDACSRRLGLVEPVPLFMVFSQNQDEPATKSIEDLLRSAPKNLGYNRYGIAVVPRFGQRLAVVLLAASNVEMEPVARRVAPGSTVSLRGHLRDRHKHPQLEVTLPNGLAKHVADAPGRDFDFALPIAEQGVHRVELLADGPYGVEVLANFPVFAGVEEPPLRREARAAAPTGAESDRVAIAARLFALLNESRKSAGVPALKEHPGLLEVADAHSRDMVDAGFFGHVSPTNGDPATRVRRKGLGFVLIAENVGRGSTADEVHAMLLDSPGHRANALDPNLTHVGVGVAIDRQGGHAQIVATQEFAGVSKPIDLASAANEVLQILNARRASKGAPKLEVDPVLTDAAKRGVTLYFDDPSQPQEKIVEKVNGDIVRPVGGRGSPVARRMRSAQSFLTAVISLDHITKIDQLFDPAARYVGIGVGRGTRPETGPETTGVLVVLGWPR